MPPKKVAPVIRTVKAASKSDLAQLKSKLSALQQVRDEVNDGRLATSTDANAITGSSASEIKAVQMLQKGNEPVVKAVEKQGTAPPTKDTGTEKRRVAKEVGRLAAEMASMLDRVREAEDLSRAEVVRILNDYRNLRDRIIDTVADVRSIGEPAESYIPQDEIDAFNNLTKALQHETGSKVASTEPPTVEELERRLEALKAPAEPVARSTRQKRLDLPVRKEAAAVAERAEHATGRSETFQQAPSKKGRGLSGGRPHSFKMTADGQFGDLTIDLHALSRMSLKAYDDRGKLVVNKKVDPTMVDLLTKRYNPKVKYTPVTIAAFRELVDKSGLPVTGEHTGKVKLLFQQGGCLPADITREKAVDRLQLLAASVEAGNNAPQIQNEIGDLIMYLHQDGAITKKESERLFRDYVLGK